MNFLFQDSLTLLITKSSEEPNVIVIQQFLDLGFERSGFEVLYTSELSPAFTGAYQHSRKLLGMDSPRYGVHAGEQGNIQSIGNYSEGGQKIKKPCPAYFSNDYIENLILNWREN